MSFYRVHIALRPQISAHQHVPTNIFEHLPAHAAHKKEYRPHLRKQSDYRLGPISVDWLDLHMASSPTIAKITSASGKEKAFTSSFSTATASFVTRGGATIAVESGSTNLPEGVIHIFKTRASSVSQRPDESPTTSKRPLPHAGASFDAGDGTILAVLAVPAFMSHSDFLAFVAPAAEGMAHVRIIRDFAPNRSIVLMKFRNPEDAQEFIEAFNGKPFNSMEPETCQVVRVASIQIDNHDIDTEDFLRTVSASDSYELPTCPVCLDRMDSAVTGLVTIPCSHTFHCTCLSKWGDSRCPVCRYSQNLLAASKSTQQQQHSPNALSTCFDCGTSTNLWICLICGNVGCGRYGRGHAQAHFNLTTHLYALELETQRVWDYASDGYVHRLIQNRADGKVVELPSAALATGGPGPADAHAADKIEAIGLEYSYLLTSQLDSQRAYYEEQASELRAELRETHLRAEALGREFEERRRADDERRIAEEEHIREYERDKARAEKRAERLSELARKLDHDLKEERAVSEGLMRNIAVIKTKADAAEADRVELTNRVNDLQDQLRDVMFFLEARNKIEEEHGAAAEAAGGDVIVPSASQSKKKRGKK